MKEKRNLTQRENNIGLPGRENKTWGGGRHAQCVCVCVRGHAQRQRRVKVHGYAGGTFALISQSLSHKPISNFFSKG